MKIGRNDPCPCGSGKKYKKCCMLNQQNPASCNNNNNDDNDDTDFDQQDINLVKQEGLLNLLHNFHKLFLERKPHIKEYKKIRKLHGEIVDSMTDYYDSGKFEQKVDPDYVSEFKSAHKKADSTRDNTLVLLESKFDLDTREGSHAFSDMMIYKSAPNINCIIEEYIQKHKYRKQEKIDFLQSMLDSTLGLFEITGTDLHEGYAYIKEVFTGREYKITDVGLSGSKYYDEFYFYTRIITYHNVSFGTGLNFTFKKSDPFIKRFIEHEKKDYIPQAEFRRFVELYNRFCEDNNGIKVITNTY